MRSFKDRDGTLWSVDITIAAYRRVKAMCAVDLAGVVSGDLLLRLSTDPALIGDVLHAICLPEVQRLGLSAEQFGELLYGEHTDQAIDALRDAIVDFSRPAQRELLRCAAERLDAVEGKATAKALAAMERHLNDDAVEKLIDQALSTLNVSPANSPASAESTPAP